MVGIPTRTLLRTEDVVDQSQLVTEERSSLAHATSMAIHGALMAVQAERGRAPTAPIYPELRWVDDDVIHLLDPHTLEEYAITARDAYFRLHQRCRPRPTGQVYLYTIRYSFECFKSNCMSSFDCLDCNVSSNESYFELIHCFVL